jgi:hypothetical protein
MLSIEELREARSKRRLTKEEKQAYIEYWQSSMQSQRRFCAQESLPLPTFTGWLKTLSSKVIKEDKGEFIAVEVDALSVKPAPRLALQFKLPNGLIIEGCFLFNEVGCLIKELSDGLTPLR